jgi:hypothetical protein
MKRKDYYVRVMKDSLIMAFLGFLIMAVSAALAPNPGNITTLRMLVQELYISYAAGVLTFRIGFGITSISLLVGTIFTLLYQWGKPNE